MAAPSGDSYIVVFKPGVDARSAAADIARQHGLGLGFVYTEALSGFSAAVPAGRLAALQNDPRVDYVEADQLWTIQAQQVPTGLRRAFANQTALDIDSTDDLRVDVDVAVLDTGIDFQHPDLNVNTAMSRNCANGNPFSSACYSGGDDDHYHGTHVAGTIGALDNGEGVVGMAPGARLISVKVLNSAGSGYTSWIVGGIDYVAANSATIEVANMSLGGQGTSSAYNTAIANAVNRGVVFVVAAGNSDIDAAGFTPANAPDAITVSALADFDGLPGALGAQTCRADEDDTLANFSNWGSTVEIAAPGVCITSTYPLEQGSYGTISGTSMASPHVAGAAALLASRNNPNSKADVTAIRNTLISTGNYNWTDDSGDGIQEPLLDISSAAFTPNFVPGSGGGGGGATSMSVGDLDANAQKTGNGWKSTLTVRIVDNQGNPVPSATVSLSTSGGYNATGSCITTSAGTCSVSTGKISRNVASLTWTVTNVTHASLSYNSAGNSDPDGDSNGTSITVNRP
jgi:subtilisin family serine protease